MALKVKNKKSGRLARCMQIKVRVVPKAKLNKIAIDDNGDIRVHTTTVPTDGKANDAVVKQLADHFNVPKSHIKLVRGGTSRDKVFLVGD